MLSLNQKHVLSLMLVAIAGLGSISNSFADSIKRTGKAYLVQGTVGLPPGLPIRAIYGSTGELSPSGKPPINISTAGLNITSPFIFTSGAGNASTQGTSTGSVSQSSLSTVSIGIAAESFITASNVFATATANCDCNCDEAQVIGSANITNLVVRGTSITVTGQPNQVVSIPGGSLIINEQIVTKEPCCDEDHDDREKRNGKKITVNALHVLIPGYDIIVGHAEADVCCGNDRHRG
jgi:hypothetical protein